MKTTIPLPEGIPTKPLPPEAELALAAKIKAEKCEEDVVELAMHSLCEAIPYLCTVSKGRVPQDELLSLSYEGLMRAARKFKPGGLRFFCYAKIYLRSALCKWWKAHDTVRSASMNKDEEGWTYMPVNDLVVTAVAEPPFEEIDIKERWAVVKPLLNELTDRERMVIELKYLGGYSFTQIARLLMPTVTREAVRVCHLRAMQRLHFALRRVERTL